jgi:hypothetical protein
MSQVTHKPSKCASCIRYSRSTTFNPYDDCTIIHTGIDVGIESIKILEANYPEFLGRVLLINGIYILRETNSVHKRKTIF